MIKTLKNKVIVTVEVEERKTKSGIYLTSISSTDRVARGNVVSVGNDVKGLKAGDKVLFQKGVGIEVKYEEKEYLVLEDEDILAVVE